MTQRTDVMKGYYVARRKMEALLQLVEIPQPAMEAVCTELLVHLTDVENVLYPVLRKEHALNAIHRTISVHMRMRQCIDDILDGRLRVVKLRHRLEELHELVIAVIHEMEAQRFSPDDLPRRRFGASALQTVTNPR